MLQVGLVFGNNMCVTMNKLIKMHFFKLFRTFQYLSKPSLTPSVEMDCTVAEQVLENRAYRAVGEDSYRVQALQQLLVKTASAEGTPFKPKSTCFTPGCGGPVLAASSWPTTSIAPPSFCLLAH